MLLYKRAKSNHGQCRAAHGFDPHHRRREQMDHRGLESNQLTSAWSRRACQSGAILSPRRAAQAERWASRRDRG